MLSMAKEALAQTPFGGWKLGVTLFVCAVTGFFAAAVPFGKELSLVSNLAVLLFAAPGLWCAWTTITPDRRWVLGVLAVFAVGIEALSITTGVPYGFFTYGEKMGYQLGTLVPWTVPFAWIPLVVGVLAVAQQLKLRAAGTIAVSVLLLLVTDLLLDPVAVKLGFWDFQETGIYYGVPFSNFVGWVVSGFIGVSLLSWGVRGVTLGNMAGIGLLAILAFWVAAALTLSLPVPAFAGVILMALTWGVQVRRFPLS